MLGNGNLCYPVRLCFFAVLGKLIDDQPRRRVLMRPKVEVIVLHELPRGPRHHQIVEGVATHHGHRLAMRYSPRRSKPAKSWMSSSNSGTSTNEAVPMGKFALAKASRCAMTDKSE